MSRRIKPFLKGFKYRIYPNREQRLFLDKTFGCCRYVYNKILSDTKKEYEHFYKNRNEGITSKRPDLSTYSLCKRIKAIRENPETPWLLDVSRRALMHSVSDLGQAYSKFLKEKRNLPKYKKKGNNESFTLDDPDNYNYEVSGDRLRIAKMMDKPLKLNLSRPIPPTHSRVTVSRTPTGEYYASFLCEVFPDKGTGTGKIGVDLGISHLAILSTGEKLINPRFYVSTQKKLSRAQRFHSRKKLGGKNRNKARLKVAKIHKKITNIRRDYMHKLTTRLISENQAIGVETLRISNMIRNRHLSKHIADASFGLFMRMLRYKARFSMNTVIVAADTFYPSTQTCSHCDTVSSSKIKIHMRNWTCDNCGTPHDRDINAAKNLEKLAIKYNDAPEKRGTIYIPDRKDVLRLNRNTPKPGEINVHGDKSWRSGNIVSTIAEVENRVSSVG